MQAHMTNDESRSHTSTALNIISAPMGNNDEPIMGTIQWTAGLEVHPNQKRQIGMQKAATKAGGSLSSGFSSPSSLNFGSVYLCRYQKNGGIVTRAPTRMPMNAEKICQRSYVLNLELATHRALLRRG